MAMMRVQHRASCGNSRDQRFAQSKDMVAVFAWRQQLAAVRSSVGP